MVRDWLIGIAFALLVSVALSSCKTIQYVPVPEIHSETEYRDRFIHDSIVCVDSVLIKEKGDTIYIEKISYRYIDRVSRDTVNTERIDTVSHIVEVEKQLSKMERMKMSLGGIFFWLLILMLGIAIGYIIKRIYRR